MHFSRPENGPQRRRWEAWVSLPICSVANCVCRSFSWTVRPLRLVSALARQVLPTSGQRAFACYDSWLTAGPANDRSEFPDCGMWRHPPPRDDLLQQIQFALHNEKSRVRRDPAWSRALFCLRLEDHREPLPQPHAGLPFRHPPSASAGGRARTAHPSHSGNHVRLASKRPADSCAGAVRVSRRQGHGSTGLAAGRPQPRPAKRQKFCPPAGARWGPPDPKARRQTRVRCSSHGNSGLCSPRGALMLATKGDSLRVTPGIESDGCSVICADGRRTSAE